MAFQGAQVAVTTGPTALAAAGDGKFVEAKLYNRGGASVYLGGSTVTTSGYQLSTGDAPLPVTVWPGETLYGASTGSITINVLRNRDSS